MATWLTHLRIAEKIKERVKAIDLAYLMVGSIAPDSGEPDADKMNYTPSKEITHNVQVDVDNNKDIDPQSFFNKYLEPEKIFSRSDKTRSFLWGYYFHLQTDKLWLDQHFRKYFELYKQGSEASEKEFVDFIREEMNSLDFEYLKQHGDEIVKQFEQADVNLDFFYEFDVDYIISSKDKIVKFYKEKPVALERPYRFLNQQILDEFISKAADKCIKVLVYGG